MQFASFHLPIVMDLADILNLEGEEFEKAYFRWNKARFAEDGLDYDDSCHAMPSASSISLVVISSQSDQAISKLRNAMSTSSK
jgi:hypothetical protein